MCVTLKYIILYIIIILTNIIVKLHSSLSINYYGTTRYVQYIIEMYIIHIALLCECVRVENESLREL